MRIKNLNQLNQRIEELSKASKESISDSKEAAEDKNDLGSSIVDGIFTGQMIFNLFDIFLRYDLPPKNRTKRLLVSALLVIGYKVLQNYLDQQSTTDKSE